MRRRIRWSHIPDLQQILPVPKTVSKERQLGVDLLIYARTAVVSAARSARQQFEAVVRDCIARGEIQVLPEDFAGYRAGSGFYSDEGVSGMWPLEERPGSGQLIHFCRAHPKPPARAGVIAVADFARWSRDFGQVNHVDERLGWFFRDIAAT